jgi:hypothetical protein
MPATEQLNIRVTAEVKERFRARAKREGLSQAELLEALLGSKITAPTRSDNARTHTHTEAAAAQKAAAPSPGPQVIDFATWLQGRTRIPRALTVRAVRAGRVTVAGVPYTAELIDRELLEQAIVYEGKDV